MPRSCFKGDPNVYNVKILYISSRRVKIQNNYYKHVCDFFAHFENVGRQMLVLCFRCSPSSKNTNKNKQTQTGLIPRSCPKVQLQYKVELSLFGSKLTQELSRVNTESQKTKAGASLRPLSVLSPSLLPILFPSAVYAALVSVFPPWQSRAHRSDRS
jgi:hypothetical protein